MKKPLKIRYCAKCGKKGILHKIGKLYLCEDHKNWRPKPDGRQVTL